MRGFHLLKLVAHRHVCEALSAVVYSIASPHDGLLWQKKIVRSMRDMQLALYCWRFGAVRRGGRRWRDDVPSVLSCPIIFVYIRPTFVHEVLAIYRRALPFTST